MRRSMGITILQIALVIFLLVSGVTGLMQSTAGNLNPVVTFLTQLVKSSTISTIIIVAIAVCELIAGFFLLMGLFTFSPQILNVIFIVLWIINIVLVDFIGTFNSGIHGVNGLLTYLQQLSAHLMVLGALVCVQYRN